MLVHRLRTSHRSLDLRARRARGRGVSVHTVVVFGSPRGATMRLESRRVGRLSSGDRSRRRMIGRARLVSLARRRASAGRDRRAVGAGLAWPRRRTLSTAARSAETESEGSDALSDGEDLTAALQCGVAEYKTWTTVEDKDSCSRQASEFVDIICAVYPFWI